MIVANCTCENATAIKLLAKKTSREQGNRAVAPRDLLFRNASGGVQEMQ